MPNNCQVIGTVAEFGNWQAFRELAKTGCDPAFGDIVDTCDILTRYEIELDSGSIVSLFRDKNGNLRSSLYLFANVLPFLELYPSYREIKPYTGEKSPVNETDVIGQVLENYYSRLTAAHQIFNVPYFPEEGQIFREAFEFGTLQGKPELSTAALLWACRSFSFPDEIFNEFMTGHLIGTRLAKLVPEIAAIATDLEQRCKVVAPPHRKAMIDKIEGGISREFDVIKLLEAGDVVPAEGVIQEAAGHKISLVFLWAPDCPLCDEVMPIVGRIGQRLKLVQGGVIGVSLSSHEKEKIEPAKQKHNVSWFDVIIKDEDAKKVNPWGMVSAFYVVDQTGRILSIIKGDECDLESVIQDEIKKSVPSFGTATSI